jgi:acyl-CoA synthetase (AMP-forming)/AMP-acid ligase II
LTDDRPLDVLGGHPDAALALIEPASGDTWTYGQLRALVDSLAGELAGRGVGPGDTVAFSLPNGPEIVAAFLAVVRAGAAAAPLNPAYTPAEFHAYLTDLEPRALLWQEGAAEAALPACAALGIERLELNGHGRRGQPPAPDPDAVALMLHTSGTTSRPKGVPIRQRNLAASVATIAATYQLRSDDVSHCVMPLFHVHGLVASTLAQLQVGGAVAVPRRFSAGAFWEHTRLHRATWFSAVPTIHAILADRADAEPVADHSLRFARSCSASLAPALLDRFEVRFGIPLVEAYGMTEAAHQMASNPLPPGERRAGSVGRATGTEVAILEDGEVAVRGPGVVDGYRNNPEANAAAFQDGWFRTGDSGTLDRDGYLHLAGRIKELINRGGEKISPHEVEAALLRHEAVREAVAFALPDAKYGEVVGAVVVADGDVGERTLTTHCSEQLAGFKVPARIVFLDTIPKGPTGKIQRRLLAEQIDGSGA